MHAHFRLYESPHANKSHQEVYEYYKYISIRVPNHTIGNSSLLTLVLCYEMEYHRLYLILVLYSNAKLL